MEINLQNIEEIIFYNSKVWQHIPEFNQYYHDWLLSIRVPGMRDLGKRAILKFLNSIENNTIEKLESFFGETVIVTRTNDQILKNLNFKYCNIENNLCNIDNYKDFCVTRNSENVSITFWR